MSHAIRKYGKDSFDFKILIVCPAERLDYYEMACIAEYNTFEGEGYNCTEGGGGVRGYHHSKETRRKQSEANIGKTSSIETRMKKSESAKASWNKRKGDTYGD